MGAVYALMLLVQQHPGRLPRVAYHLEAVQGGTGVSVAVVADTSWVLPQSKEHR